MKFKRIITLSFLSVFSCGLLAVSSLHINANDAKKNTVVVNAVDDYYSSITDDLTGEQLRKALNTLNNSKRKSTVGYAGMRTFSAISDADPNGSGKILSFYDNALVGPSWDSGKTWNREHVWPNARGGSVVEGDAHMTRPNSTAVNSGRGSKGYSPDSYDPGQYVAYYRGSASRIIFYSMIANTSLNLSDDPFDHDYKNTDPSNTMGSISAMLEWNLQYLPSDTSFTGANDIARRAELNRNDAIQNHANGQGNRNPFIDHPEYACRIWGDFNDKTRQICSGQSGTVSVTGVSIAQDSYDVNLNGSTQLSATVEPSNATTKAVTWSSSDTSVVTVSTSGVATGLKEGSATITVTTQDGGFTDTCTVNVVKVSVTGVSLNKSSISLQAGQSFTLTASVLPQNASNKDVTWSSDNTSIASVTSGKVSAVGAGKTNVKVTTVDGGFTATCEVTVIESPQTIPVESVSLNETRKELVVGEKFQLKATINPSTATNKDVVWSAESMDGAEYPSVLVSNTGLVTADTVGTSKVIVTTIDGMKTAECIFVVKEKTAPAKRGCGGNVVTSSVIISTLSILGISLLLIKRNKRFNKQ